MIIVYWRCLYAISNYLAAPARRFAALVPLNKNNCANCPETGHHKAKWFKRKAEPPKHEKVTERNGDRGDKNDEERTVHNDCSSALPKLIMANRLPKTCPSPRW